MSSCDCGSNDKCRRQFATYSPASPTPSFTEELMEKLDEKKLAATQTFPVEICENLVAESNSATQTFPVEICENLVEENNSATQTFPEEICENLVEESNSGSPGDYDNIDVLKQGNVFHEIANSQFPGYELEMIEKIQLPRQSPISGFYNESEGNFETTTQTFNHEMSENSEDEDEASPPKIRLLHGNEDSIRFERNYFIESYFNELEKNIN
jgi:hypothetical protein